MIPRKKRLQCLFNTLAGGSEDERQQRVFWEILNTGTIPVSRENFAKLLECAVAHGGQCLKAESLCPAIRTLLVLAYFAFLARTQASDDDPTHRRVRDELETLASIRVTARTVDVARSCHTLLRDHYKQGGAQKFETLNRFLRKATAVQ